MTKPKLASLYHALAGVSTDEDPATALVQMTLSLVDAGIELLSHISSDAQLRHPSVLVPGGTLGKHFRHVAETFDALLSPLGYEAYSEEDQEHGFLALPQTMVIDYDALLPKQRQKVARKLDVCRAAMGRVRVGLGALAEVEDLAEVLRREVIVVAVTPTRQEMASTLGRELWFCALHTIHHYTMVRTIAVHELGIALPEEFGTAPATLQFRPSKAKL